MAMLENPSYRRQLDGLRALSVAAVAWSHWRTVWNPHPSIFPGAELGVETFFVISGFLITGILLDNRSEAARPSILRQFYIRRFLRIFPLFYLTILIGLLLQADSMGATWFWHVTYLCNIYFYLFGWHGFLSHFWSLAVEEQFYFFWPLLMVFLPARILPAAILLSMLAAPLYAMDMNAFHPGVPGGSTASILMPSCLGALGMGAFLAWALRNGMPMRTIKQWLLCLGLLGVGIWYGCGCLALFKPVNRLAEDCILGWLVFSAAAGFGGVPGWFLSCAPLNYLGKISYGLYIIHNFATPLCSNTISLLGKPAWLTALYGVPTLRVLMFIVVTVGLASLSWFVIEKPINNLKHRFPYPGNLVSHGSTASINFTVT
jgi:peptidoglycan/LPS O-acetylase OafA/YrhL